MKHQIFIYTYLICFLNMLVIAKNSNDPYFTGYIENPTIYDDHYLFNQDYVINIKDIDVTCQTIPFKIDINLSFTIGLINHLKTEPEIQNIKKKIVDLVKNYPDKTVYWEKVNKTIVQTLVDDYPQIENLQSRMKILANEFEPNDQWSRIRYYPKTGFEEIFGFAFNAGEVKDEIDSKSFLEVEFSYINEIKPQNYIDIFLIKDDLINFYCSHYLTNDPTSVLKTSAKVLLKKYTHVTSFNLKLHRKLLNENLLNKEFITITIKEMI